jgi:hypothetical protein
MSFWNTKRDKILQKLQASGHSAAQIAERLGTTRGAVIGRSARLRGLVFASQLRREAAEKALREKRLRERKRRVKEALSVLKQALARGAKRHVAATKAKAAGATYQEIGNYFGVSRQAVHQMVRYK